ncbi:MAG: cysteine--tRNA ligase [Candidatus Andersenbacteria bacterium]
MPEPLFYNSLTKHVEPFKPLEPGKVSMYHCGPTVYKRQHLGNLRRFLFADVVRRTLEFLGYEVREITNITDVGHLTQDEIDAGADKLEVAAKAAKVTPQMIADEQTKLFMEDLASLNIQPSHKYPRATKHIKEMQQLITTLIEKGHAYATPTGVYFDVASYPAYGELSGNTVAAIAAGKRVAVRDEKKQPVDFALWIIDNQSLQKWDSPWGTGYPGWHIECSAMSMEYLGTTLDIHTGGEDNRFPHHENERAQSEAATGKPFVRMWLHNRHLQLDGKKLAKREGEQITLDTVRDKGVHPLAFRLFVFSAHYRTYLDFTWENLKAFSDHLVSFRSLLRRLHEQQVTSTGTPDQAVLETFGNALADDVNTPTAWAIVLQYVKTVNTALEQGSFTAKDAATALATLLALDKVVGVFEPLLNELAAESIPAEIQDLAQQREAARANRQFEEADRLRVLLEEKGFVIEDTPRGPRVVPKGP